MRAIFKTNNPNTSVRPNKTMQLYPTFWTVAMLDQYIGLFLYTIQYKKRHMYWSIAMPTSIGLTIKVLHCNTFIGLTVLVTQWRQKNGNGMLVLLLLYEV
mgnify:CR=1 FL=1